MNSSRISQYPGFAIAKAANTRKRRTYPTPAQKAAFAKSLQRDGRKLLTAEECELLATHPALMPQQKAEFAALAIAKAGAA